ncbi:hypothetical protein AVDCRST_MAG81-4285 [uncultured Synechococcales cyanobacterium]|uniref:Uncharacterized protein n=1 Tax=uncultured Synechococcales cyanobacterium TaxID=1936017 RepID=A0A6J4VTM7_9CYAN|nr:hypothetical protein AVDCRST_MAG81-4285 [uncultured Synechococcales cyanobacterium]
MYIAAELAVEMFCRKMGRVAIEGDGKLSVVAAGEAPALWSHSAAILVLVERFFELGDVLTTATRSVMVQLVCFCPIKVVEG